MAIRPRLKSRTGCHNCRDRRVKCDEIKPSCSRCTKWKLKCEWPNLATLDNTHAISSSSTTTPLLPVSTSLRTSDSSLSDKKGLDSRFIAKTKLAPMFDERGISVTDAEFQNILIEGIRDGWTNTRVKYYLDLRWSSFIATMDYLELCGHGLSSRLSAGWNMRLLSRHMSSRDDSLLPSWWIPKEKAPSHLAFANFAPWPNIRAVLMRATYLTTSVKFKFDWSRSGVQFIWPYSFEDAYVKHEGGLRMSDEFVMRLANLRSYATTKHFLDLYPDFRGEMPQLEPSPTLYTPLMTNRLEELYWRKVRERRKQRLRRRSERETVSPEEPARDFMSIVLGRPQDRTVHTSQIRSHSHPPTR